MKTYTFKNGAEITIYYENGIKLYMVTYTGDEEFCITGIMSWKVAKEYADNIQQILNG